MSEYLTPEEVESLSVESLTDLPFTTLSTLREYAAIVNGLAETDGWWCKCPTLTHKDYYPGEGEMWFTQKDHAPDCLWLRARRVRGLADRGEKCP